MPQESHPGAENMTSVAGRSAPRASQLSDRSSRMPAADTTSSAAIMDAVERGGAISLERWSALWELHPELASLTDVEGTLREAWAAAGAGDDDLAELGGPRK